MKNKLNDDMPKIDMERFKKLNKFRKEEIKNNEEKFINLIKSIIEELDLTGKIDYITVGAHLGQNAIYRTLENPWPEKKLHVSIEFKKWLDENLLRHEFGHEADRHNPDMHYDPEIENNWKGRWEFNLAANISLDSRLGDR